MPSGLSLEALQAEMDAEGAGATDPPAAEETATEEALPDADDTTPEGDEPPETEDEPVAETEGVDESPEPEETDTDPQGFTKWYDQRYGRSYSGQFKTDQEFVDALFEKDKLVGQRNEDAQKLKQLRDRIGEERLESLLVNEPAKPADSKPAPDANMPRSVDEYLLLQDAAGRPDATPATRDKYNAAQKALLKRFIAPDAPQQDAESISAQIEKVVAERMEKYTQTADERQAEDRTKAAESHWIQENIAKLYVDGDPQRGLTPLGTRVDEIIRTDPDLRETKSKLAQWRLSLKMAIAERPAPKQPRTPSQKARRQAAVKTGTPKEKTVDELFADGKSLAEVAQIEMDREQAVPP